MKKIFLTSLILSALMIQCGWLSAQKTQINETTENLGGATNPAFSVFIENADYKYVVKQWKALLESNKGKVETSKNDVNASNVILPLLSSNTVAVFSKVIEDKTGVKLVAAFSKDGHYVSGSHSPAETETVKKLIYDFAVSIKKYMIQNKLDDASKELSKLTDKQKDLTNKKEGLDKDIVNYQEKIKQAESDIQENLKNQAETKQKIETQTKVVEDIKTKLSTVE